ncbi:2-hydroxyacid dehydrogenase [Maritimibacter sp. DP1N21-5]|uniref:2-hydroxyacid dehydrogenase n=1 Tax=Maritimibacter sp. DP1N21-5 TaxID=2836867 RepID=UPI001C48B659|nr:NAD(P)-dependent oxidoreductase [Maritimibacter sp. DP1N21-5]MBV7408541.1 hypothetical protein [Maritimibacter sp. DP1N21-5]
MPTMTPPPPLAIRFLDDDHVIRLIPALLAGPNGTSADYVRDFFSPEKIEASAWAALTRRLEAYHIAPEALSVSPEDSAVLVFRRGRIDTDILDAHPNLRLIQRLGSGPHTIDLDAASERGIAVSCITRPSLVTVAEHCLMLMLAASRRLIPCDHAVRRAEYAPGKAGEVAYNWPGMTGIESLYGKTLGILGMGEVGTLLAERARAFGMRLLYCDESPLPPAVARTLAAERVDKAALFARADILSIHIPGTPANRKAVGAREIALMKPEAILINTSRGSIVDEDALCDALETGRLSAAALDVHGHEPRGPDRITALPNVVLTPHLAAGSRLNVLKDIAMVCDNLLAVQYGDPIVHGLVPRGVAQ